MSRYWSPTFGPRGWVGLVLLALLLPLYGALYYTVEWYWRLFIFVIILVGPTELLRMDAIQQEDKQRARS